ncbi:MAG: hypothetical protein JNK82_40405 [Myxococcaceae bacterium]|nr:hypothetical protein [Myxococcaceae bacterium]
MSLERRITAILSAPKPGAAMHVHTSAAFAARFSAEAKRSGLSLDLAEPDLEAKVKVCAMCGAQNSPYVSACFNCQTELETKKVSPPAKAVRQGLPEARWHLIANAPRLSTLPLRARALVQARFAPAPQVARVESTQVSRRFLELFVEKEAQQPKPPMQRFDQRSALDKFLSVFVEKHAPAEGAAPAEDSGTFQKVLSLFVEKP